MQTLIHNLGAILSGDIEHPLIEAEAVLIEDGIITAIGDVSAMPLQCGIHRLDAMGTTLAPGLIDSHVHVVFGDWTPRQNMTGWIESYLHGGITSMMSASEVHLPGRPTDPDGVVALAMVAHQAFANHRPAGVKIHAGSIILEPGLTPRHFQQAHSYGVWLAKMGFGHFDRNLDAAPLVRAARENGMVVMSHTGGVSIPGSNAITADDILGLDVDIAGHVNGGTTALPEADLRRLIRDGHCAFQISQAGNIRSAVVTIEAAAEADKLARVLISSDTPTGTGVMPLGTLKSVVEMAALTGLPSPVTWAMATGNNARVLRQNTGIIAVGREADCVLIDSPSGSAFNDAISAMNGGDLPGISAVLIDGEIKLQRSRNTPLARRLANWTPATR